MVEVANPGTAALIFSGEFAARLEPRTWIGDHFRRGPTGGRAALCSANSARWPARRRRGLSAAVGLRSQLGSGYKSSEFPRLMLERDAVRADFPHQRRARAAARRCWRNSACWPLNANLILWPSREPPGFSMLRFCRRRENSAAPETLAQLIAESLSHLRPAGNAGVGHARMVSGGTENVPGDRLGTAATRFRIDAAREEFLRPAKCTGPGTFRRRNLKL